MKKLLMIYLISVLVIISSFMNIQVHKVELDSSDYFFAFTPGMNTLIAVIIVKLSIDNVIAVESK